MSDRPRILVIDDDPLFRNIIVAMLRRDFTVSVAAEGSEGYFKALENPPDAAIVDIHMPGWNGVKTIEALRGHPALAAVKIIVLTADDSRSTLVASMQAGADDHLLKTRLCREAIVLKLEQVLPGVRLSSAAAVRAGLAPPRPAADLPAPYASLLRHAPARRRAAEQPARQGILDCWD